MSEHRQGLALIRGCFKNLISWFSWFLEMLEFVVFKRGLFHGFFPWLSWFPVEETNNPLPTQPALSALLNCCNRKGKKQRENSKCYRCLGKAA